MAVRVVGVISDIPQFKNGQHYISIRLIDEFDHSGDLIFGPYPADSTFPVMLNALEADIKTYARNTWGLTVDAGDTIRLFGNGFDL